MFKGGFIFLAILLSPSVVQAEQVEPLSIDVYITHGLEKQVVNNKKYLDITHVKYVDENLIENQLNEALPKFEPSNETFVQYQEKAINFAKDWVKKNKPQIMKNVSVANEVVSKNIQKIPAIVIDDNYVVYGSNITDSIKSWREAIDKNVNGDVNA